MQVRFLGTGTPDPDPLRCGSGTAILPGPGSDWLLVDCGRGVSQRVLEAGLDLGSLRVVLLTHHHSDHVSDLASVAIARFVAGATTPLRVVAPAGPTAAFATSCLDGFVDTAFYSQRRAGKADRPEIRVESFPASEALSMVHRDPLGGGTVVEAVRVDHGPMEAAVGYRMRNGNTMVVLSGDTRDCDGIRMLASGADLLVHQALLTERVGADALEWNASAGSAGDVALASGVGHLALTHLMPSPGDVDDEARFVVEARSSGYPGPITIARDLAVLDIT